MKLRVQEALRRLRESRRGEDGRILTQRELGSRRGVSGQAISNLETAVDANPRLSTIEETLEAMGAGVAEFLEALAAEHELDPIRAERLVTNGAASLEPARDHNGEHAAPHAGSDPVLRLMRDEVSERVRRLAEERVALDELIRVMRELDPTSHAAGYGAAPVSLR